MEPLDPTVNEAKGLPIAQKAAKLTILFPSLVQKPNLLQLVDAFGRSFVAQAGHKSPCEKRIFVLWGLPPSYMH